MKTVRLTRLVFVLALLFSPIAGAVEQDNLVKAEMLADVSTIAPGEPFTVGIKLNMAPKWHVYWVNPGDTGIPTEVSFQLPPGFTAGALKYPIPHQFDVGGGIVSYGYEDEVMLLATITPPPDLPEGSNVTLTANVSWLVCQVNCVKGDANVKLALRVGDKAKPENSDLFAKWRGQLPGVPSQQIDQNVQVTAPDGRFKSAAGTLILHFDAPPQKVEWFPITPAQLMFRKIDVKNEGARSTITYQVEALAGEKFSAPSLPSVIAYTVNGKRVGVLVPVSLSASKSQVQGS